MTSLPIVTQPLEDLVVRSNAADTAIDLSPNFDDPLTTGQVARFELADSSLGGGVSNVLLFDQAGAGAPATVANFLNYVNDGDYVNSIIHRSVPGFIVQGGGFLVNPDDPASTPPNIPTDDPVVNEFSADRSNTRGTIAMAKLGSDPDSATSQWFFNLSDDNAANLDNQNGGFTVFGEVLNDADLEPVDAIANLPISDFGGAFSDLPLNTGDPNDSTIDSPDDLVRYSNITVTQADELEFEITSNSNPELVNVNLNEGELLLDYVPNQTGTAEITIQATDLLGDSVSDTFTVTVEGVEPTPINESSTVYRFLNNDTGVHLYTASDTEREFILANLPNYVDEGEAYRSVDALTGSPQPQQVYRFLNRDTGTHLYTISEQEKEFVETNLGNFDLESQSFFAYTQEQPDTIPVYRFLNNQTGAHFYTPSVTERDFVTENLSNFESEGIAYYASPLAQ